MHKLHIPILYTFHQKPNFSILVLHFQGQSLMLVWRMWLCIILNQYIIPNHLYLRDTHIT